VSSRRSAPARSIGRDQWFVGREPELAVLRESLLFARRERPRLVLVEGPAGIGKTSILEHFVSEIEGRHTCVWVCGEEAESGLAMGVADQVMRAGGASDPQFLGPPAVDMVTAGTRIIERFGQLQEAGPVVLLVDDAHWADAPSLRALGFALRRLAADAVLTVVALRDERGEGVPDGLRRLASATVEVGALAVDELGALVDGELPRRAMQRLHAHTGGNPLFAKALSETVPREAWLDPGSVIAAPQAYARSVARRWSACSDGCRRLVAAVAVLGSPPALSAAAALAGLEHDGVRELEEAIERDFLKVEQRPAGRRLAFVHPLTRAAVYNQLGELRRTRLHAAAAELMPDERQAVRHLVAATAGPDAGLASRVERLAASELARGAMGLAATHLLASAQVSEGRREYERRTLLATDALLSAGDFAGARALEARIAAFAPVPMRDSVLGFLALTGGRPDDAERLLARAWEACDAAAEPGLAATIAFRSAMHASLSLDDSGVLHWTERSLASTVAGTPEHGRALTLRALALAKVGRRREAGEALGVALARDDDLGSALGVYRGWICLLDDDLTGARAHLTNAVAAASRLRRLDLSVLALVLLAAAEFAAGAWDDAVAHGERARLIAEDLEHSLVAFIWSSLIAVPAARGEWERAESYARAATQMRSGLPDRVAQIAITHAQLRSAEGDSQAVIRALSPLADEERFGAPLLWGWHHLYVDALVDCGELDAAESVLSRAEGQATARGLASVCMRLARSRGRLEAAAGRDAGAEHAFEAALELNAPLGMPYERALTLFARGQVLRRSRRRRDAAASLSAAVEVLAELGAGPVLERCERELAACGLRPAKRSLTGPPTLTPQERTVVELVRSGAGNREIAAELMLSPKTVEFHLTNIYRKLGVTSRAALLD
jgi:DNA-binding CsgD family transcriptional regulator